MGFWNQLDSFFSESTAAKDHSPGRKIGLFLLFFILNTVILSMDFLPDYFSLSVGQVSDRDVSAPRTVSFVDEPRTKKLEAEVLAGVANVYDLDTGAAARDTSTRVFTEAYASPEQREGRAITTSSDIYSLGVLLRELVQGSPRMLATPLPALRGSA